VSGVSGASGKGQRHPPSPIDEYVPSCLGKYLPDEPLALSDIHVDELGALDREEVAVDLGRDGLGQQRLARPRRPIQEDARPAPEAAREQLWVLQRELDGIEDAEFDVFEATHVVPLDIWDLGRANL